MPQKMTEERRELISARHVGHNDDWCEVAGLLAELDRVKAVAVEALKAAGCMRLQIGRPRCGTERPKLRDASCPPDRLCMVCAALKELQADPPAAGVKGDG